MKKSPKLDKSLLQVHKWSKGSILSADMNKKDGDDLILYIETSQDPTLASFAFGEIAVSNYGESILYAVDGNLAQALDVIQKGGRYYTYRLVVRLLTARKFSRSAAIDLDTINRTVFLVISVGMPNLAQKFYRFMMKELETGNVITNGHTNFMTESLRYSAMAMTIFNDWLHLPPPDLDKLALPKDPVWMKYANNWREENIELFAEILNEVCDVHIERIGMTQKEYDSGEYEFTSPFEAVYPAEILGVLRLRERVGLQNPELTHPLLLTPYAQITSHAIDHMPIEDPLLDDYLAALRKYNPELIEAWDQFEG